MLYRNTFGNPTEYQIVWIQTNFLVIFWEGVGANIYQVRISQRMC